MAGMIHREIYTYAANGHGGDYDDIIEELHARFRVSKRQARNKLATFMIEANQSIHRQTAEITR